MWRVPRLRFESGLLRRRGAALLLALLFEALLVLLLLFLVPPAPGGGKRGTMTTFTVDANSDETETSEATRSESRPRTEKAAKRPPTPEPPVLPPPVPVPETPHGPLPFIVMTRQEYGASRIENMRSSPSQPAAQSASSGASRGGDTPVVGTGPNGEPLYAAEWVRRPRQAELATYLPQRWAREGSGLIACRTVARYHVDDCRILGETPPGSGYGNAVLQAAWQFLVRPPRVGGEEMVGTWVSIRIDYSVIVK